MTIYPLPNDEQIAAMLGQEELFEDVSSFISWISSQDGSNLNWKTISDFAELKGYDRDTTNATFSVLLLHLFNCWRRLNTPVRALEDLVYDFATSDIVARNDLGILQEVAGAGEYEHQDASERRSINNEFYNFLSRYISLMPPLGKNDSRF